MEIRNGRLKPRGAQSVMSFAAEKLHAGIGQIAPGSF
jgi:hypothetical protein